MELYPEVVVGDRGPSYRDHPNPSHYLYPLLFFVFEVVDYASDGH